MMTKTFWVQTKAPAGRNWNDDTGYDDLIAAVNYAKDVMIDYKCVAQVVARADVVVWEPPK
jgi:hypothetical protein